MTAPRTQSPETQKLLAEAEHLRLEAAPLRRRELVIAKREVWFNADVEEFEVNERLELLRDLEASSDEPITVVLNSPGGDTFDGFLLYDYLRLMRPHVTTKVYGWAASAGGFISQAGDVRL